MLQKARNVAEWNGGLAPTQYAVFVYSSLRVRDRTSTLDSNDSTPPLVAKVPYQGLELHTCSLWEPKCYMHSKACQPRFRCDPSARDSRDVRRQAPSLTFRDIDISQHPDPRYWGFSPWGPQDEDPLILSMLFGLCLAIQAPAVRTPLSNNTMTRTTYESSTISAASSNISNGVV